MIADSRRPIVIACLHDDYNTLRAMRFLLQRVFWSLIRVRFRFAGLHIRLEAYQARNSIAIDVVIYRADAYLGTPIEAFIWVDNRTPTKEKESYQTILLCCCCV